MKSEPIHEVIVSVIMPAYNAERFIAESISSVIAQTYTKWELLIIDDGSTDASKSIVESFMKKDNRIHYIYQNNGKQGRARNTGIEAAKGDLIAFLDADDIWLPYMLEKQVLHIKCLDADLVYSGIKYMDESSKEIVEDVYRPQTSFEGVFGLKEFLRGNPIPILTVVSKKDAIIKAGGFNVSNKIQYGEDYDLWLRMLLMGYKLSYNSEPLVLYRKHGFQSSKLSKDKYLQMLQIIERLPDEGISDEKKAAIYTWLKRAFNSRDLEKRDLRKLFRYIPSLFLNYIIRVLSYILPRAVFKTTTIKLLSRKRIEC